MSEEHVAAVFGPEWVREAREFERSRIAALEKALLSLRRMLIARDPTLPEDPYDGQAWQPFEREP